jgi:hypothetical protein
MNHVLATPAGAGISVAYAPTIVKLTHRIHQSTCMHIVYILEQQEPLHCHLVYIHSPCTAYTADDRHNKPSMIYIVIVHGLSLNWCLVDAVHSIDPTLLDPLSYLFSIPYSTSPIIHSSVTLHNSSIPSLGYPHTNQEKDYLQKEYTSVTRR